MACSDWINLLVAIGTISLAVGAFLNIKHFRKESRRTHLRAHLVSCRKWAQSYLDLFDTEIDIRTNKHLENVKFNLAKLSDLNSSIVSIQYNMPDSILKAILKEALNNLNVFGLFLSKVNVVDDFEKYKDEIELARQNCIYAKGNK